MARTGLTHDPTTLILTSLAGGPKHGHLLARDIEEFSGVRLGPGTLYGAITRLEERGLIEALEPVDRRRPYSLTIAGAATLAATVGHLGRVVSAAGSRLGPAAGVVA